MSPSFVISASVFIAVVAMLFTIAVVAMLFTIVSAGVRKGDWGCVCCAVGRHRWYTWINGSRRECSRPFCREQQIKQFVVTPGGLAERWR